MKYEIAHTFSDFFIMPLSLEIAAKSERRFLSRNKITAFYTPPRSDEIYKTINDLITVKKVPNVTNPFSTSGGWYSHYGEKIHASSINSPNILFMDCDILTIHNPECLFDDDFDVAVPPITPAMKEIMKDNGWQKRWNEIFKKCGKTPIPHFEIPIILFKDNILKEIKNEYMELIDTDLPRITDFFDKEQMVFALVLSGKKIKRLDYNEFGDFRFRNKPFYSHIREWEKESNPIIWHIGNRGLEVTNFE